MTNKAYIVANEEQECEVLDKLEREGLTWWGGDMLIENIPSKRWNIKFPYVLFDGNNITWNLLSKLEDEEIVFDGRKEEQMSDKYVVSQEFVDELEEWKDKYFNDTNYFVSHLDISNLPHIVSVWKCDGVYDNEANNRLIAIIRWVNGEDVFEVEKPKKWVVRSKECNEQGNYLYIYLIERNGVKDVMTGWTKYIATKFDTKEEAEGWANSHQEVVEIEG